MTDNYGNIVLICLFLGGQVQKFGQYIEKSFRFRSWHNTKGVIITAWRCLNDRYVTKANYEIFIVYLDSFCTKIFGMVRGMKTTNIL